MAHRPLFTAYQKLTTREFAYVARTEAHKRDISYLSSKTLAKFTEEELAAVQSVWGTR